MQVGRFEKYIKLAQQKQRKKAEKIKDESLMGQEPKLDWNQILKSAIWNTFFWDIMKAAFVTFIFEALNCSYTFSIMFLIDYINEENADPQKGYILAGIFIGLIALARFFGQYCFYVSIKFAVMMRRTITLSAYGKIQSMNVKGLA